MDPERRARLLLHLVPGLGPVRARAWIARTGSARAVAEGGRDLLEALGVPAELAARIVAEESRERAEAEVVRARREGIVFLFPGLDGGAPELLEIDGPPLVLTAVGRLELLEAARERIAVVGSRTPTPYGARQAARFGGELAAAGCVVVSGFARGVDRAAHCAALDADGDTIAVLGSGLRRPYPADAPDLLRAVETRGLVLSELPIDAGARRSTFPRRNRILSGLSRGVVVVEAGRASGSLLTARWALDQDRDVCAIPGRVDSPLSAGCHDLLRAGAALVESPADVLAEVFGRSAAAARPSGATAPEPGVEGARAADAALLAAAGDGATLEELAERCALSAEALFARVVSLELAGRLVRGPGGLYRSTS